MSTTNVKDEVELKSNVINRKLLELYKSQENPELSHFDMEPEEGLRVLLKLLSSEEQLIQPKTRVELAIVHKSSQRIIRKRVSDLFEQPKDA